MSQELNGMYWKSLKFADAYVLASKDIIASERTSKEFNRTPRIHWKQRIPQVLLDTKNAIGGQQSSEDIQGFQYNLIALNDIHGLQ